MATLDLVQKDYSTDPSRVILTGLSNGGYGVWHIGGCVIAPSTVKSV